LKLDFFVENMKLESFTINKSFSHVVSFTAIENKIILRTMKIIYDDVIKLFSHQF